MAEKTSISEPRFKGRELIRNSDGTAKDVLSVVLQPDKEYSTTEANKLVDQFLKKEVKR